MAAASPCRTPTSARWTAGEDVRANITVHAERRGRGLWGTADSFQYAFHECSRHHYAAWGRGDTYVWPGGVITVSPSNRDGSRDVLVSSRRRRSSGVALAAASRSTPGAAATAPYWSGSLTAPGSGLHLPQGKAWTLVGPTRSPDQRCTWALDDDHGPAFGRPSQRCPCGRARRHPRHRRRVHGASGGLEHVDVAGRAAGAGRMSRFGNVRGSRAAPTLGLADARIMVSPP